MTQEKEENPLSERHRDAAEGAPSLPLAAAAAHQWPEAIPETKLAFFSQMAKPKGGKL